MHLTLKLLAENGHQCMAIGQATHDLDNWNDSILVIPTKRILHSFISQTPNFQNTAVPLQKPVHKQQHWGWGRGGAMVIRMGCCYRFCIRQTRQMTRVTTTDVRATGE